MTWLFIYVFSYVAQLSVVALLPHCNLHSSLIHSRVPHPPTAAAREVMILAGLVGMFSLLIKAIVSVWVISRK